MMSEKPSRILTGLSFLAKTLRSSTVSIFAEMEPAVGCTIGIDDGAKPSESWLRASILLEMSRAQLYKFSSRAARDQFRFEPPPDQFRSEDRS